MKAKFRLEKVDEVDATLTITMSIAKWRKLQEALIIDERPAWEFSAVIKTMIAKAIREYQEYAEAK
jgi:hypothetical protein